jgi:ABC-2 type transport system permease protein
MNPKRILADFRVYARSYLRSPEAVFFSLFFPFMLAVMFGLIYSGSGTPSAVALYVVDQDPGNAHTAQVLAELNHSSTVNLHLLPSNTGNLANYLASHSESDGLLLPKGFGDSWWNATHNGTGSVEATVYTNPSDPTSGGIVVGTVNAVLNKESVQFAVEPVHSGSYTPKVIDYTIPGLIGFAILVNPMFSMVTVSSEYKKEKLFKALSLTPLTKGEWLLSKILWHWAMAFISTAILFGTGIALFGAHLTVGWLLLPLILVGTLLFVSLGMLVGSVTKKAETAGFIGNLVTFPMMILGGGFFPVAIQPAWLQPYARIWPLFYIIDGIQAVSVFSNTGQALVDLGIVTVMAVGTFLAAVAAFRWRGE